MFLPLRSVSTSTPGAGESTMGLDATRMEPGNDNLVLLREGDGTLLACAQVPSAVLER